MMNRFNRTEQKTTAKAGKSGSWKSNRKCTTSRLTACPATAIQRISTSRRRLIRSKPARGSGGEPAPARAPAPFSIASNTFLLCIVGFVASLLFVFFGSGLSFITGLLMGILWMAASYFLFLSK